MKFDFVDNKMYIWYNYKKLGCYLVASHKYDRFYFLSVLTIASVSAAITSSSFVGII